MENNTSKWSWWGFFFCMYYYAGYGNIKKALCLTLIWYIPLIGGLVAMIYAGAKANEELPVGKQEFKWKNVFIVIGFIIVYLLLTLVSETLTSDSMDTLNQYSFE